MIIGRWYLYRQGSGPFVVWRVPIGMGRMLDHFALVWADAE